jgi:hypothetical protein
MDRWPGVPYNTPTLKDEKAIARRLLAGIENGTMSTADAVIVAEDIDPVLFYVIVSFLRETHPASDRAANSILERVVHLTKGSAVLVRRYREGAEDPITRWFESEYTYGEFRHRGPEMIDLITDKIES